jgi:tetratricopeptide (TPR) repeat protein
MVGALAGGAAIGGAQAQRLADLPAGEAYNACLDLARQKPSDGFEAAIAWRGEGGGPAAQHCTAMALVNLGQFADAATRLEALADEMKDFGAAERAAVLGQSGRAWLRAGRPERARAVLTVALRLAPDNVELHIDRGEVLAADGQLWEAVDDFNIALDRDPANIDGLIFRGAAYRLLKTPELARLDLEAALARDANNPDALVELGAVALQEGQRDAARQHWLRAISVAPSSPAADAARRWLERLDVKTR